MTKLTSAELAQIMLRKKMTYPQILEEGAKLFPDREITMDSLHPSIRAFVLSPHVDIQRFNGRKVSYLLTRVDEKFLRVSATRSRAKKKEAVLGRRPEFDPKELQCCELTSKFNQLLMPVRQRYLSNQA
jgi:hypothetical protein